MANSRTTDAVAIGNMNGGWAALFKVALVMIPILAISQGWICLQLYDFEHRVTVLETKALAQVP